MKAKNRVFDLLIQGKSVSAKDADEEEAVVRYFDLALAKEYGWTQFDILHRTTQDFFNDAVLKLQKEAFFRQQEAEKAKTKKS